MNIYDTKPLACTKCNTSIGEIDWDARVIRPLCGKCANPLPVGDKILYTVSYYRNNTSKRELLPTLQN